MAFGAVFLKQMNTEIVIIMDTFETPEDIRAQRRFSRYEAVLAARAERDAAKLLASLKEKYGDAIFQHIYEFLGEGFFSIDLIII